MATTNKQTRLQGKDTDVNGEGNEKANNTSSSLVDLATYTTQDNNPKIAGMAKGYLSRAN